MNVVPQTKIIVAHISSCQNRRICKRTGSRKTEHHCQTVGYTDATVIVRLISLKVLPKSPGMSTVGIGYEPRTVERPVLIKCYGISGRSAYGNMYLPVTKLC